MTDDDPLIDSLRAAVEATPEDVPLRVHLGQILLARGRAVDALEQSTGALRRDPGDRGALDLAAAAVRALGGGGTDPGRRADPDDGHPSFDWAALEDEIRAAGDMGGDEHQPGPGPPDRAASLAPLAPSTPSTPPPTADGQRPSVTLDDVGGMESVKAELAESFLVPMANPALRAAFSTSLRGGLLLYGPPGCGKTYLGRALAGELGAGFYAWSLADVLDAMFGQSERNVRELFDLARAHRPAVIFLDEVDAIGQKRANLRSSPTMRGTVNQLLSEMDGATGDNDGLFLLGASNQPWDVDPALRRPGRFDRTVFVPPPDVGAREAILRIHMAGRPAGTLDLAVLARDTAGYSGADLVHLCDVVTRRALADSARRGQVVPIEMGDLQAARERVRPTTREWFTTAQNVVRFANQDGTYDDLAQYMDRHRL